jgi:TonB family protein
MRSLKLLVPLVTVVGMAAGVGEAQSRRTSTAPPALDVLLDSAALLSDAAALRLEPPRGVRPLFRIAFDSTGQVEEVEAVFAQIPAAYADPVVAAIRARARVQPHSPRGVGTTFQVITGPGARVDRPVLRESQPELSNRVAITRELNHLVGESRIRTKLIAGTPRRVMLRFRLDFDGVPIDSTIAVTHSAGDLELDATASRMISHMRFRAARVDGTPVRVWIELPVDFRLWTGDEAPDPALPRPRPRE